MNGRIVTFRARIHTIRRLSAKLVFLVFRQQTTTIQGVLQSNEGSQKPEGKFSIAGAITAVDGSLKTSNRVTDLEYGVITENMVRTVEHYYAETIVLVTGKIRPPPQKVKNATIHDAEIQVFEVHLLTKMTEHVPFTPYDAENANKGGEKNLGDDDSEKDKDTMAASRGSIDSVDSMDSVASSDGGRVIPHEQGLDSQSK